LLKCLQNAVNRFFHVFHQPGAHAVRKAAAERKRAASYSSMPRCTSMVHRPGVFSALEKRCYFFRIVSLLNRQRFCMPSAAQYFRSVTKFTKSTKPFLISEGKLFKIPNASCFVLLSFY
jgi:hypothetical protein